VQCHTDSGRIDCQIYVQNVISRHVSIFESALPVTVHSLEQEKEVRMSIVLSPMGVEQRFAETVSSPPRLASLSGKRLGMLDNGKPKADVLEGRIDELLRERFDIPSVVRRRKLTAQEPAAIEDLIALAEGVDLVVNGLGD